MRKKLLCAMLATIMMLGATGCDLGKKPDKPEVPKKTIKEEETNQKFKEINGKMEVYLPIHYVYSSTQEGKKTGYEVYFTYDNRGLLLEKEFYDVITKKAFEMGSPDSYRYDKEYQMVSAVYNVGEKWNYSYHYDQGKLTDFDVKYVDSGKEISCYTFDKKTGLLKEADHKSESRLCYSYEQDEHGRITKYSVKRLYYSDKDKAEEGGYRYEYDQEGNVVKEISLYSTEHTEKTFLMIKRDT